MTDAGSYPVTYTGYYDTEYRPVRGVVPVEEVITLCVNGQPLIRLICTPVQLEELAIGFLFNQGLIETPDEGAATIRLSVPHPLRRLTRWYELTEEEIEIVSSSPTWPYHYLS